ncbi:MAG: FMN-binding negative transcriptional regulator [Roseiflexaceae bacterium]
MAMYIPRSFHEQCLEELLAFMQANSFITLVSVVDGVPYASHVPVAIREHTGEVTLHGHLAKANPHWQHFGTGESLAIFTGPHAYISPTLYEKVESVPTWNYIAVHATGPVRSFQLADDQAALLASMELLIQTYEHSYQQQWDSLSETFREGMLKGIVGFELQVAKLEGKYKLSQNRSMADRHSVARALLESSDAVVHATGLAMQKTIE